MFESDDFDQVLSQFDFGENNIQSVVSETCSADVIENSSKLISPLKPIVDVNNKFTGNTSTSIIDVTKDSYCGLQNAATASDQMTVSQDIDKTSSSVQDSFISPKHTKRKIIDSLFKHNSKRRFPGPAGLLSGSFEQKNEAISHIELLSQDTNFSQSNLRGELFESPLWTRLLADVKGWHLNDVDSIQKVKQQALSGHLRRKKAQTIIAFIEAVDRSATDPLVILRDQTGNIKCTLHRDAWSAFSSYIVSESCAVVLWKPTVLTTGSAFKKHYLNITLNNIYAIYSTAILVEDTDKELPTGYVVVCEDEFTVIKAENIPDHLGTHIPTESGGGNDLLDGLDSIFSDELF